MTIDNIASAVGGRTKLFFKDGEIVIAILLGVTSDREKDLTYEVVEILAEGSPVSRGSTEGATCVAKLSDLQSWDRM